jgi:hypothetical protein
MQRMQRRPLSEKEEEEKTARSASISAPNVARAVVPTG